jgi:hypothetical protein
LAIAEWQLVSPLLIFAFAVYSSELILGRSKPLLSGAGAAMHVIQFLSVNKTVAIDLISSPSKLKIMDPESTTITLNGEEKTLLQFCTELLQHTTSIDENIRLNLVQEISSAFQKSLQPKSSPCLRTSVSVKTIPSTPSSSVVKPPAGKLVHLTRENAGLERWYNLVHLTEIIV